MLTYFERDFVVIKYDAANQIIVHKWLVPPVSEEFREGMEAVIDAIKHFKTGQVMSDTSYLGIILNTDQEWVANQWFKKASKEGYSHLALILPQEHFTQMTVKDTVQMTKNNNIFDFSVAYFSNIESARLWLKQAKVNVY